jgi:hypothetical protein
MNGKPRFWERALEVLTDVLLIGSAVVCAIAVAYLGWQIYLAR